MSDFLWLYVPTSSRDEAKGIARALLAERLVACVNIFDNVTSMYHWQGDITEDDEVMMVAKTRRDHFEAVRLKVEALHSYDCPCVVGLEVAEGNPNYLAWLEAETQRHD